MLRGGSWNNNGNNLRSAERNRNAPASRNNNIGLRVAAVAKTAYGQSRRQGWRRACKGSLERIPAKRATVSEYNQGVGRLVGQPNSGTRPPFFIT